MPVCASPPTDMNSFQIVAGTLVRSTVRDLLEREQFRGACIEWLEQKGLFYSSFAIRGVDDDVRHVYHVLHIMAGQRIEKR